MLLVVICSLLTIIRDVCLKMIFFFHLDISAGAQSCTINFKNYVDFDGNKWFGGDKDDFRTAAFDQDGD